MDFARGSHNLLVNHNNTYLSAQEPIWWNGIDTGAGVWPIGPNGPNSQGNLPAVSRATSLIVNTLASLPWRVRTGIALDTPRWLSDPMLQRPDARLGEPRYASSVRVARPIFWAQWVRSALLEGMGYLLYEPNVDGVPMPGSLRVLNPTMVEALTTVDGYAVRRIGGPESEYVTDRDGYLQVGAVRYRLWELNSPLGSPDEKGLTEGVLSQHRGTLELASSQQQYAANVFASGVPAGYLKVGAANLTEEKAQQIRAQWMAAHGSGPRSIAVLGATTEFTPLTWSPYDSAIVDMQARSIADIANLFGVPVFMLGGSDGGSLTYETTESRSIDFRAYTLQPWASAIEETLSALVPAGSSVEIDFSTLLRTDTANRYSAYETALRSRWMTIDEVRAAEGLPPLRGSEATP